EERRGKAVDSLVSGGCIISGACVSRSVLFSDVRVHSYSTIEDSVILPNVDVGRNVTLKKVVIDKGSRIPEGMKIGVNHDEDRKRFHVSEKGIVLVTPEMLGQNLHQAR
ncbi:MAG: glucose-1-phosphate adenylyltransferase, partial [Methylobacillus sp.]|nr:glucose-1-phosphate adenylyltransferase [Methylobacillus sp.]